MAGASTRKEEEMPAPDLAAVKEYLGDGSSWSDAQITKALAAEKAAQANVCRMPVVRTTSVGITNGSPTITGVFTSDDVGREITLPPLPVGTTVVSVSGDGSSATLSASAVGTGTVSVTLADPWPSDLAEALLRRVARNLAMRALPLGLQTSMSEAAVATVRVGNDPEIRRLEAFYRKVVLG